MRLFVALLINMIFGITLAQAASPFAGLKSGPYKVGFRVVQQYDYARSYREKTDLVSGAVNAGERARPVEILVWYPAQAGGRPITYQDYMRTEATDEVFDQTDERIANFMAYQLQKAAANVGMTQARSLFDQTMLAKRDAQPVSAKFPVVVYAAGSGGAAYESADMFEYLASHGYIIVSSRNMGASTREIKIDWNDLDSQVRDLQFLIAYAHSLPQSDMAHVAAMGWSWGGMANVFAAARDNRIAALVSLDGTRDPEFTKTISPTRVALPWLYISRRADLVTDLNRMGIDTSFSLLNALCYADVYEMAMDPMTHVDFSSAALRFAPSRHFDDYSREEVETAYRWVSRYVLEFFNAHLKNERASLAFLNAAPVANGVPAHMAHMRHTAAKPLPPDRSAFAAALAQQGFEHALDIYTEMRRRNPSFKLTERDINLWGYQLLLRDNNVRNAIQMFKFGIAIVENSANLFDSLGEAYELDHNSALAIDSYRRSLALDPTNGHASARLAVLSP
jgi:predicted dienelactone hydrolase